MVEVEAHVVNIKNAVAADDKGLLKPPLKRWQDDACSQMVFGLSAVRAVINFKWDRSVGSLLGCAALCCAGATLLLRVESLGALQF